MVKVFMSREQKELIKIVSGRSLQVLSEEIDPQTILSDFGGQGPSYAELPCVPLVH